MPPEEYTATRLADALRQIHRANECAVEGLVALTAALRELGEHFPADED